MADPQVPDTAYLTALARAEATADPAGGLRDPYAARFAEHCPASIRRITRHTAGTSAVVARTLVIDRLLTDLLTGGRAEVCVNLGAGFDARPHRLDWPAGCRVVELDCAPVLDLKDSLLPISDTAVPVQRLRCDLRDPAGLAGLLRPHTANRPTAVLAEGLLTYFPESYVSALAAVLAGLGAPTTWVCDVLSVASARSLTTAARAAGTSLELHGLPDLAVVEGAGWRCEQLELLPTARTVTAGQQALPASRLLPDCVLVLSHEP